MRKASKYKPFVGSSESMRPRVKPHVISINWNTIIVLLEIQNEEKYKVLGVVSKT